MPAPEAHAPVEAPRHCWCGNADLRGWSDAYLRCEACQTLWARHGPARDPSRVENEASDLYGLNYFLDHARALGHPPLADRARLDLPERCAHWLRALLEVRPPPGRALELGCANGAFVGLLAEAGYEATGLDLSPAVTAFVRDTFQVPVLTGPLEAQRLAPASLDVVAMMDVLEHLPDPLATLRTLAGLLAPGGVLLIQTPRFDPARSVADLRAAGDPFLSQLKPQEHLLLLSPASVEALLRTAGFGHVRFVPAVFPQYDMSLVASPSPLARVPEERWRAALGATRGGRVAAALMDAHRDAHSLDAALPDHALVDRALRAVGARREEEPATAQAIRVLHEWRTLTDEQPVRARELEEWRTRARELEGWKARARAAEWLAAHPGAGLRDPSALPLVTIVTPSLGQAGTLAETIASVAAQTYPRVEHVVVDGGSTDGTIEVLRRHPELRWISEPDRGQADAINKGLRLARGEIVAYVNSDDLLYPDAVSTAVDVLLRRPDVEFLYGDGTVVDAEGRRLWDWLSRPEDWRLLAGYFFLWNDFTNYIMQPATFWRRALHERIGTFDEGFHFAMDVEFWLRVGSSGARMLHVAAPLAKFRLAPTTKTGSSPTAFWPDHLELFRRYHGPGRMRRYVEQYLAEEVRRNGVSMAEALARYERIAERRWSALPEAAALRALGTAAVPGAWARLADDAWNAGDAGRARRLLREAVRCSAAAPFHRRALVLLGKLAAGPLSPVVRRAWTRGIAAYRDRRYQYRYRGRAAAPAA